MTRYVVNQLFQLFTGGLNEAYGSDQFEKLMDQIRNMAGSKMLDSQEQFDVPVALRWLTKPVLGFPHQPFEVWRRAAGTKRVPLGKSRKVKGFEEYTWDGKAMYCVELVAAPDPGHSLTIGAVDALDHVHYRQQITFTQTQRARFRHPGIVKLRIGGQGVIYAIQGVSEQEYANLSDWERVQVVGMPYDPGEAGLPVYDVDVPQGYEAPAMSGGKAAWVRLEIARLLQMPIPSIPGLPTPDWNNALPDDYLDLLRYPGDTALLPLISNSLKNTDDVKTLQETWQEVLTLEGIRQADIPGAAPSADPADVGVPVTAAALLAISGDSEAATALGYGTIDFPAPIEPPVLYFTGKFPGSVYELPVLAPPGEPDITYDYMVTATFTIPQGKIELAALGQRQFGPFPAVRLRAAQQLRQRPSARDANPTEAVRLNWDFAPIHQGYGVAVSPTPTELIVLNGPRRIGGYDTFMPPRPPNVEEDALQDNGVWFVDNTAPVPFSGSAALRYYVIGRDVFGRWSQWRRVIHTLEADPVQQPSLHSVEIVFDRANAVGRMVPAEMHIEFSWHWADRSPHCIEFSGGFYPYLPNQAFAYNGQFMLQNGAVGGTPIQVTFTGFSPAITSGHVGEVYQLVEPPPPVSPVSRPGDRLAEEGVTDVAPVKVSPSLSRTPVVIDGSTGVMQPSVERPKLPPAPGDAPVKYRLTLKNIQCDFSTVEKLRYAVYARGTETIRPTEWSAVTESRTTDVFDPLPPTVPSLSRTLQWTALPDVTGKARGLLQWEPQPHAFGYNIWESTETALRPLLNMDELATGTTFESRAQALKTGLENAEAQENSLHTFARLNKYPIKDTHIELALPGGAETIFVYRISSVSENNEESERSKDVVLFAVPQIRRPTQPTLLIRNASTGLFLIVIPGPGSLPTGYELYRVKTEALTREFGLMGPPKVYASDPGWRSLDNLPAGTDWDTVRAVTNKFLSDDERLSSYSEEYAFDRRNAVRVFLDPVPPRWSPYYYRAVALIADNMNNGLYGGRSRPSVLREGKYLPKDPPLLEPKQLSLSGNQLTFTTDLPIKTSPYGKATLEVFEIKFENGAPKRETVLRVNTHDVPENASGNITRGPVGLGGRVCYTVQLLSDVTQGAVVVTDPAGRSTQVQFKGETS
jgi:hypothetical protein